MKKGIIHLVLAALVFSFAAGYGCSKSLQPVTETHIGGMPLDTKSEILFKLNTPVAKDALVQVPGKQENITVNIFPADENGNPLSSEAPQIILAPNTDRFKLNQTMSKKDLTKGTYLMNIVYSGRTERVLFSVK